MVDTRHVGAIGTCCERVRVPRGGSCILIFSQHLHRTTTSLNARTLKRGSCAVRFATSADQGSAKREIPDTVYRRRRIALSYTFASVSSAAVPQFRRLQCLSFVGCSASVSSAAVPQFRRLQCLSFVGCSASVSSAAVPQFRRLQCLSFVGGGHVVALMRPTSALARWHWRAWTAARQRPTPPHPPRSHCRAA